MDSIGGAKKTAPNIYEYPEHLNPFREEDNHNRLRFWNIGRKKNRSSSFSFASLKDFRNTLNFRSFRKKDRTSSTGNSSLSCVSGQNSPDSDRKYYYNASTNNTPVMYRNSSIQQNNQGNYTGPLPRSRFHERVSHLNNTSDSINSNYSERASLSPSHQESQLYSLPMINSRGDRGSFSSLQSNPFDESADGSLRSSTRKKRRAPMPPQFTNMPAIPSIIVTEDTQINKEIYLSDNTVKHTIKDEHPKEEIDIDDPSFKTELRIIEDDDVETNNNECTNNKKHEKENKIVVEVSLEENNDNSLQKCEEVEELKITEVDLIPVKDSPNIVLQNKNYEVQTNGSINEIPKSDVNMNNDSNKVITNENTEKNLFKRVDVISYKRRQSLDVSELSETQEEKKNELSEILASKPEVTEETSITTNPTESKYKISSESSALTNDFEMSEFKEFDQIIRDIERNAVDVIIKPEIQTNKRVTVSDMKLIFENTKINDIDFKNTSPNPIPKPRRSRIFNSSSSDTSKTPSTPSTPMTDEKFTIKL